MRIVWAVLFALIAVLACNPPIVSVDASPPTSTNAVAAPESTVDIDILLEPPAPAIAVDTRSLAEIAVAACTSTDGSWRCRRPPPKVMFASATASIIPISWTVPAWFIDPQNTSTTASDSNDCITSATACLTWQEIAVHRLNTTSPRLRQTTAVTFTSSQTNNTDPVEFSPFVENGAVLSIQGAAPTVVTSGVVLSGVVAKNTNAGTNSLLQANLGATAAAGQMVENTTHSSRAFVYKSLGSNNFSLTQPMVKTAVGGTSSPAEVDTWANGDSVNLLTPISINIASFQPMIVDDAGNNVGYLYQMTLLDPSGVAANGTRIGHARIYESIIQRKIYQQPQNISSTFFTVSISATNVLCQGGYISTGVALRLYGGANTGLIIATSGNSSTGVSTVSGDYIVGGTANSFAGGVDFGLVYIDGPLTLNAGGEYRLISAIISGHIFYGSAGSNITLLGSAHLQNVAGSFVGNFTAPALISPGIILNGASTACSHTNASPDVVNCGIATTPANLDAAAGAAGFGGDAYFPGGASVSTLQ